jgi:hypothetical protein
MSYINFYTYKLKDEQLDALYIRNLIVFLLLLSSDGRHIRISGDYTADAVDKAENQRCSHRLCGGYI